MSKQYQPKKGIITKELSDKTCQVCGQKMYKINITTPLGFSFFEYRCSSEVCPSNTQPPRAAE